jgi:hypothetical protein
MSVVRNVLEKIRRWVGLDKFGIPILILLLLLIISLLVDDRQHRSEQTSLPPIVDTSTKEQYEIAKLGAEIKQIRSDTSGSLYWLKLIALFVTVGGAVGGYLAGQRHTTKQRLEFENLKNIDSLYQGIVLDLSDNSNPVLRAAAAVRLGMILKSFPSEWVVDDARKKQMIQLTKQVLAASLAIDEDPNPKLSKTLTIALALHQRWEDDRIEAINRASNAHVNIPFAFHAGDRVLSKGDYTVGIEANGAALAIRGRDSRTTLHLKLAGKASEGSERAKLIFHRYGENHFLSEVRTPGKRGGRKLPKSDQERKLERQLAPNSSKEETQPSTCEMVEALDTTGYADVRELDLSGAKAADAFWARVDFSSSDFFKAKLAGASFRDSVLRGVAFREADLTDAVMVNADCEGANFKLAILHNANLRKANLCKADLRNADLTNATLVETKFADAKVYGCVLTGAKFGDKPDAWVDDTSAGDGSHKIKLDQWLKQQQSSITLSEVHTGSNKA